LPSFSKTGAARHRDGVLDVLEREHRAHRLPGFMIPAAVAGRERIVSKYLIGERQLRVFAMASTRVTCPRTPCRGAPRS
jgi:hypothetical protein